MDSTVKCRAAFLAAWPELRAWLDRDPMGAMLAAFVEPQLLTVDELLTAADPDELDAWLAGVIDAAARLRSDTACRLVVHAGGAFEWPGDRPAAVWPDGGVVARVLAAATASRPDHGGGDDRLREVASLPGVEPGGAASAADHRPA
jgi:hypothetical protein